MISRHHSNTGLLGIQILPFPSKHSLVGFWSIPFSYLVHPRLMHVNTKTKTDKVDITLEINAILLKV